MCFATLTKGVQALAIQSFVTAELEGVGPAFRAELESVQANLLRSLAGSLPGMPPKAYRWVGEMEEIVKTGTDVTGSTQAQTVAHNIKEGQTIQIQSQVS